MAWRRITSKRKEQERVRQEISKYTEDLVEEMNLRLLLEAEMQEDILFVESIVLTNLQFPVHKKKRDFLKQFGKKIKNKIQSWLAGSLKHIQGLRFGKNR